ncbi:hypothetical protein CTI12_AA493450 [Artemisia annua]|uniref:Uncharacterized protein n=1 Tax=Artemisia annua TaxID=35608 RepID=A0A2U1LG29_ARTAN|nr:hypothetical protein CTI12_AA493450 [Artemisia annua]
MGSCERGARQSNVVHVVGKVTIRELVRDEESTKGEQEGKEYQMRVNKGRTRREGVPDEVLERSTQQVGSSAIEVGAGPSQPVGTQANEVAAGPSQQVGTQASHVSQSTGNGGGQRKKRIKRKANIAK